MDNQHRKIKGCRELSQEEVDLMNAIKTQGADLLRLQDKLVCHLSTRRTCLMVETESRVMSADERIESQKELNRFNEADPLRWAAIGKTDIQTGIMALVRAVAQPAGV